MPRGHSRLTWRGPPPAAGWPTWSGACGRQTGRPPRRPRGQSPAGAAARRACWRLRLRGMGSRLGTGGWQGEPGEAGRSYASTTARQHAITPGLAGAKGERRTPLQPPSPHAPAPASARSDSTPVTVLCAACSRLSMALSFRSLAVSSVGVDGWVEWVEGGACE